MNKRKNDFLDDRTPRWVWMLAPVLLLAMGVGGLLLGQRLARQNIYVIDEPPTPADLSTPISQTYPDGAIPLARPARVKLDIAFVFDTTGSMGDELAQLQNNVLYIASNIAQLNSRLDVQYGLVAYKDQGDEYVKQVYPFTNNANQFQANLMQLSAGGGGDTPEDLAAALEATLHQLQWRSSSDTIQLVFVVTDASAQLYGGFTYMDSLKEAAQRGIKIHSLAASGMDPVGEYMLRQASEMTMGRFIFLTYDTSVPMPAAMPGSDRPDLNVGEAKDANGVGEYVVEQLPQLVLRLIREEVAYVLPAVQ